MQLIRAINKSNKSNNNNNNQTSSASNNNKVVIIAPPTARSSSVSQQKNGNTAPTAAPVSPSVAIPALKKRTSIVKQSVPPPVPPRGSPRSKSKLIGVSRSHRHQMKPKPTIDVDRLKSLSSLEQSGCQKVKKWLETVDVPTRAEMSIPEQVEFRSVQSLIENFAPRETALNKSSFVKGHKVSDSSLVRNRVASYNSLERDLNPIGKVNSRTLKSSDGGTDSGIDIPARFSSRQIVSNRKLLQSTKQFSRDGEFV